MDNLALQAIIWELRPAIVGQTIQRVRLRDEAPAILCLSLCSSGDLVFGFFPSLPLCFLSRNDLGLESRISEQSTLLRRLLVGARFISIKKQIGDRIVFFELENHRSAPSRQKLTLVLELLPCHANVLIVEHTQQVLFSLRRPKGLWISGPELYRSPVSKSEIQCDRISREEFERLLLLHHGSGFSGPASSLASVLGLSQTTLHEILFPGTDPVESWERLQSMIRQVDQGSYCPQVYGLQANSRAPEIASKEKTEQETVKVERWVVTPFPFRSLREYFSRAFPTMSDACEYVFMQLREQCRFAALRRASIPSIQQALKKKSQLLRNLQDDLAKHRDYAICKKYADLLYAQKESGPPGVSYLKTIDLFDSSLREIEIPLDPKLSLIQNANRFSLLFQKANRALPRVLQRVGELETELTELRRLLDQLSAARNVEQLEAVTAEKQEVIPLQKKTLELPAASRLRGKGTAGSDIRLLQRKVARRFVSTEGMEILVGKSNRANDTLTQRIAKADDFWFHVAGYSGSHVVLKNPKKLGAPPQQSLLEAAQLAAYFSQARNAPKVEVHYSQRKFVSKARGGKPGLMQLKEYKSVMVRPGLL